MIKAKNIKVSEKVTVGKNPSSFQRIIIKTKFDIIPMIVNDIAKVITKFLFLK